MPKMEYMGVSTIPFVRFLWNEHQVTLLQVCFSFFLTIGILLLCLGVVLSPLPRRLRVLFPFLLFLAFLLRFMILVPAATTQWNVASWSNHFIKTLEKMVTFTNRHQLHSFVNFLPFFVFVTLSIFSFYGVHKVSFSRMKIRRKRLFARVPSLGSLSRDRLFLGGFPWQESFHFSVCFGLNTMLLMSTMSYNWFGPKQVEKVQQHPHLFVFAIDSLRADRLLTPHQSLPYLSEMIPKSLLQAPFLMGVPRTFSSWAEILSGREVLTHGIRHMFPSEQIRQNYRPTLIDLLKKNRYSVQIISDFAGDVFPRLIDDSVKMQTPNSNMQTLIENSLFSATPLFQSFFFYPKLAYLWKGYLENPDLVDPGFLSYWFGKNLTDEPQASVLFFSAAHFPYATPGPFWTSMESNAAPIFKQNPVQKSLKTDSDAFRNLKKNVIHLYDNSLRSIDFQIQKMMTTLKSKGYLENAVVVVLGDHGENLFDGTLGMGHGDGVGGIHAPQSAIAIWKFEKGAPQSLLSPGKAPSVVYAKDFAPSILSLLSISYMPDHFEGQDVLNLESPKATKEKFDLNRWTSITHSQAVSACESMEKYNRNGYYQESGIWFTPGSISPEGYPRTPYPGIMELLSLDHFHFKEFYLSRLFAPIVYNSKERAWNTASGKWIVRTNSMGSSFYFSDRFGVETQMDLFDTGSIAENGNMKHLNDFLMYLSCKGMYLRSLGDERLALFDLNVPHF